MPSKKIEVPVAPARDTILAIARECIDQSDEKHEKRMAGFTTQLSTLQTTVSDLSSKVNNMYGNGSGRKGAIELLQDKGNETAQQLASFIATQKDENTKQQLFRHDMRNSAETREKVNNKWVDWLKYAAGPIGLIIFELFKEIIKKHFGL